MNSAPQTRRIQIVSNIFRVICLLSLILLAIGAVAMVAFNLGAAQAWQAGELKPEFGWIKRPVILLTLAFPAVAFWRLYRLFSLTARQSYFTADAVRHIKFLGCWMIVYWATTFGLQFLQFLSNSKNIKIGLTLDGYLFGGVLVLLLGWIIDEGRQMSEEQQLTV